MAYRDYRQPEVGKGYPIYRVWIGEGDKTEWIEVARVLVVIKLTGQNRVGKPDMRAIDNALKLVAAQSDSGVAPDVAVGRDVYENPDQDLSCTQRSRTTRR